MERDFGNINVAFCFRGNLQAAVSLFARRCKLKTARSRPIMTAQNSTVLDAVCIIWKTCSDQQNSCWRGCVCV